MLLPAGLGLWLIIKLQQSGSKQPRAIEQHTKSQPSLSLLAMQVTQSPPLQNVQYLTEAMIN